MTKFRTKGLIIREQIIGEQDKLLHILTDTHGVIKAFAKGAKNIRNGKSASTSLLSYSQMTVNEGRENYYLSDARTLRVFHNLRADMSKMCLAQYFCELALTACPQGKPAEEFLRLMLNGLWVLDQGKRKELLIKACVEMRMAALAGYLPDLIMCNNCGVYRAPIMVFYPETGRLLCGICGAPNIGVFLAEASVTALRHTVYAESDKLFSFSVPDWSLEQLNKASEAHVRHCFEKEFKTLEFYKKNCEPS